jgi:hypothetical protein
MKKDKDPKDPPRSLGAYQEAKIPPSLYPKHLTEQPTPSEIVYGGPVKELQPLLPEEQPTAYVQAAEPNKPVEGQQANFMQTVPDSHSWTDFEMLLRYLSQYREKEISVDYLITGLKNSISRQSSPSPSQGAAQAADGIDPKEMIDVLFENRRLRLLLAEATGLTHYASIEDYKKYLPSRQSKQGDAVELKNLSNINRAVGLIEGTVLGLSMMGREADIKGAISCLNEAKELLEPFTIESKADTNREK